MTVQNRIRSVVCVLLLLGAFAVFVPHKGTTDEDAAAANQQSEADSIKAPLHSEQSDDKEDSLAADDIRPLFFDGGGQTEFGQISLSSPTNPIESSAIDNQYRPLLPFKLNEPRATQTEYLPIGNESADPADSRVESIPYVIESGDTLQKISIKFFGRPNEYLKIYEFNQGLLDNPLDLPAGMRISIPRY